MNWSGLSMSGEFDGILLWAFLIVLFLNTFYPVSSIPLSHLESYSAEICCFLSVISYDVNATDSCTYLPLAGSCSEHSICILSDMDIKIKAWQVVELEELRNSLLQENQLLTENISGLQSQILNLERTAVVPQSSNDSKMVSYL